MAVQGHVYASTRRAVAGSSSQVTLWKDRSAGGSSKAITPDVEPVLRMRVQVAAAARAPVPPENRINEDLEMLEEESVAAFEIKSVGRDSAEEAKVKTRLKGDRKFRQLEKFR